MSSGGMALSALPGGGQPIGALDAVSLQRVADDFAVLDALLLGFVAVGKQRQIAGIALAQL